MTKYAEDFDFTVDLLKKNYPKAKTLDIHFGNLADAFPKGIAPTVDSEGRLQSIGLSPDPNFDVTSLLETAEEDQKAFDILIAWVHGHMLQNGHVPDRRAARFAAQYHFGKRERPKKRTASPGGRRSKDHYKARHALLRLAVAQVQARGYNFSRNEATETKVSACDIVAEAMTKLRFSPATAERIAIIVRDGERVSFYSRGE